MHPMEMVGCLRKRVLCRIIRWFREKVKEARALDRLEVSRS